MNYSIIQSELFQLLEEDLSNIEEEKLNSSLISWENFGNLYFDSSYNGLMLRFNSKNNSITIARVSFNQKGKGNFSKLEKILLKLNPNELIIESILTDNMLAIANHLGYCKINPKNPLDTSYIKCFRGKEEK